MYVKYCPLTSLSFILGTLGG
jgi:ATP-dependent DNA helicase PIF1